MLQDQRARRPTIVEELVAALAPHAIRRAQALQHEPFDPPLARDLAQLRQVLPRCRFDHGGQQQMSVRRHPGNDLAQARPPPFERTLADAVSSFRA